MHPLSGALTVIFFFIIGFSACSKKEIQHVRVTLRNGDVHVGTLERRDAASLTLVTPSGDARTFLMPQVASVDVQKTDPQKKAPEAAPEVQKTDVRTDIPETAPRSFVPPQSGKVTLTAGTLVSLRLREALDGGEAWSVLGNLITSNTVDDIAAAETTIPAETPVNLSVINRPGSGGREIVCSLSSVFLGGRAYLPDGGSHFGGKDPLLGSVNAPPKETLPPSARELPVRLPFRSVLQFKLPAAVTLRESK